MINNIINSEISFDIPEGYSLDAVVPSSSFYTVIFGLTVVFAIFLMGIIVLRKRHKFPMFGFFGGISIYLIFAYFAVRSLVEILFAFPPFEFFQDSDLAKVIIYSIMASIYIFLGRWISYKVFSYRKQTFAEGISYGVGMFSAEALFSMINFFMISSTCMMINSEGIETIVSSAKTQEEFTQLIDTLFIVINYTTEDYVGFIAGTLAFMIFHLAITVPMFATYQNKIDKKWYLFVIGAYTALEFVFYLGAKDMIHYIVTIVGYAVVVGIVCFVSLKIYRNNYESEEVLVQNKNIQNKKKMPKFNNVSKL